jgi:hypothetical protein
MGFYRGGRGRGGHNNSGQPRAHVVVSKDGRVSAATHEENKKGRQEDAPFNLEALQFRLYKRR